MLKVFMLVKKILISLIKQTATVKISTVQMVYKYKNTYGELISGLINAEHL